MTSEPTPPWRRADRVLLAALLGLLGLSLIWSTHAHFDARNDASLYLVVTRALLDGEGLTYLGEPFVIRPPGFALLLAPVLGLTGTDMGALNLYVSLWGVALVALLFVYLRPRVGAPLAAAAGTLVWFAPGVQVLCNQVMSDVPGVTLLLAGLVLERRTRAASTRANLGLGLFIGLAALVRTMDVLLLPAVIGARVIDAAWSARALPRERALWLRLGAVTLGTLALVGPWISYSAACAPHGATDQTHIHSYATAQWHQDPSDPASPRVGLGEFLGRTTERLPQVSATLGTRMSKDTGSALAHGLGALGLLAVLLSFLRRREAGELFVLGALLVVGTYFAYKPRLVLPLFVLSVGATIELLALFLARVPRRRTAEAALAATLTLVALLSFRAPDVETIAARDGMRHAITERLLEVVPEGAVIGAATGWDLGVYLPGRPVVSLRFAFKRDGAAGLLRVLEEHDVRFLALYQPWQEDQAILAALFRDAGERYRPLERFQGWVLLQRTD